MIRRLQPFTVRLLALAAAIALAVTALVVSVGSGDDPFVPEALGAGSAQDIDGLAPAFADGKVNFGLVRSRPTSVSIPSIDTRSTLLELGLEKDGSLEVPRNFDLAGWYGRGAYPGQADAPPALIAGHVDDRDGPAVFYRLNEVKKGDVVEVDRATGTTALFVVDKVVRYPKAELPTDAIYAPTRRPTLVLITCGGAFDESERTYRDNVVVFATLDTDRSAS